MKNTAIAPLRKSATSKNGSNGSSSNGSNGKASSDGRASSNGKSQPVGSSTLSSKLQKLFEDELKDIYWAENALVKALPKMAKKATSPELKEALDKHLGETKGQVGRLEQIFEILGKKAQTKKCEAMAGLIKEAEEIMADTDAGVMRDAGIISAGQKVEHYEIASYGTLRQFAQTLGLDEAADLLQETLDQEKAADEKLTEVAESVVNVGAAEEEED
ncbi:MAG: hypothetical protein JWO03_2259 [Bacteroidetes bacterium]|nr:hypothetical protein [Bacteroidota bacterium]